MKNSLLPRTLTTLTGIALAVAALTAEAKLTVGDPAPKLQVAKWVQGDPVKSFDTKPRLHCGILGHLVRPLPRLHPASQRTVAKIQGPGTHCHRTGCLGTK